MKNGKRNTASAAVTNLAHLHAIRWSAGWLLLVILLVSGNVRVVHAAEPGWVEEIFPANDSTRLLALAANREHSVIAMLYSQADKDGAGDQLRLLAFESGGKQFKSADLGPSVLAGEKIVMHSKAGLAVDANGVAYIAVSAKVGQVMFSRIDLRRSTAALTKPLKVGSFSAQVMTMLMSKGGSLLLGGAVDGKGFVSSVSRQGAVIWTKYYDSVATVLDILETDSGLVLLGGVQDTMFFKNLWLARTSPAGEVLETQTRPGPNRFGRLGGDARRIGLVYEKLGPDMETSTVLMESFTGAAPLKESKAATLYQGQLVAPYALAQVGDRLLAAGVVARARLQLLDVWPEVRTAPLFVSAVKAPDFIRYHSVEVVGDAGAIYLASLRSRADGRRQRLELVFAKVPAK